MNDVATPNPAAALKARYVLHERLGAGGQGEVWRAHDPDRDCDIALKILRPAPGRSDAAWEALLHEYESANRLDHPFVLKVYPPEREDNTFLLPMELASGGDLRRLRGAGYLAIVPVLVEVAQALEHAHEHGVIHRDLKPGNVLFDARGRVKLADFGVSGRALDPGTDAMIRGLSPFTASPEQLRGEPPSPADDIYGLGALAYELLSSYPPHYPHFDARRVQEEAVPPLVPAEQIPPQLDALIMRMLAKSAARRPAAMAEVIDDLEAALNDTLTFDFDTAGSSSELRLLNATGQPADLPAQQPRTAAPPPRPVASPASPAPDPAPQTASTAAASAPATSAGGAARAAPPAPAAAPRVGPPVAAPPVAPAAALPPPDVPRRAVRDPHVLDGEALWREVRPSPLAVSRFETRRGGGGARALLTLGALILAAAIGAFLFVPGYFRLSSLSGVTQIVSPAATTSSGSDTASTSSPGGGGTTGPTPADSGAAATSPPAAGTAATPTPAPSRASDTASKFDADRRAFDQRLGALETRGADAWGGQDLWSAKTRAAEAVGAHDAGSDTIAGKRLAEASQLLAAVEHAAPAALAAQLAAGDRAIAAGQRDAAAQAYELAARIDPNDQRAAQGLTRARQAAGPDDAYAKAAGEGFAALGAGRLDEARASFERARALRPNGAEAVEGLRRVEAAGGSTAPRNFAGARSHAADLESQERWQDALTAYNAILRQDHSQTFAQQGRARAQERLDLDEDLQALIDRPDLFDSSQVRNQANALLQQAEAIPEPGPILTAQIARIRSLLPGYDKPVRLSLTSDSLTQVEIESVGNFGTFARRDIELKPGRYTVIGTRDGYRDVRRDITVSPGQQEQTINVSCSEQI
ncbi:MAG TPA: serine/threonine-protein kinase [Steroidobacteraceae bacterium]|nr:serine/threonine-protein kinase [Steroidobacteraceae bacterium]